MYIYLDGSTTRSSGMSTELTLKGDRRRIGYRGGRVSQAAAPQIRPSSSIERNVSHLKEMKTAETDVCGDRFC